MVKPVIMGAILQSTAIGLVLFKPVIVSGIPTFWLSLSSSDSAHIKKISSVLPTSQVHCYCLFTPGLGNSHQLISKEPTWFYVQIAIFMASLGVFLLLRFFFKVSLHPRQPIMPLQFHLSGSYKSWFWSLFFHHNRLQWSWCVIPLLSFSSLFFGFPLLSFFPSRKKYFICENTLLMR